MNYTTFYTCILLSIGTILFFSPTKIDAAKKDAEKEKNIYFLKSSASVGFLTAFTISLITKTKRQKLWHIPAGIASWIWMYNIQKNYQEKHTNSSYFKNTPLNHTNKTFLLFYSVSIVAVEGSRGLKNIASYIFKNLYSHRKKF